MCRETIESHHGRIRVDSTVGKGTAFTLKLPGRQHGAETCPAPIAARHSRSLGRAFPNRPVRGSQKLSGRAFTVMLEQHNLRGCASRHRSPSEDQIEGDAVADSLGIDGDLLAEDGFGIVFGGDVQSCLADWAGSGGSAACRSRQAWPAWRA